MVHGVDGLGAQLQAQPLADAEVLEQREIPVVVPVAPNVVETQGEGADVGIQRLAVVPLFGGLEGRDDCSTTRETHV